MCSLQVLPNRLNDPNRKTIKYPKIYLAKKTFAKKVQKVQKVQPSPFRGSSNLASRPRWSSCSASASSPNRACRRSWRAKRSSAKDGYHELRPAPPRPPRPLLQASRVLAPRTVGTPARPLFARLHRRPGRRGGDRSGRRGG